MMTKMGLGQLAWKVTVVSIALMGCTDDEQVVGEVPTSGASGEGFGGSSSEGGSTPVGKGGSERGGDSSIAGESEPQSGGTTGTDRGGAGQGGRGGAGHGGRGGSEAGGTAGIPRGGAAGVLTGGSAGLSRGGAAGSPVIAGGGTSQGGTAGASQGGAAGMSEAGAAGLAMGAAAGALEGGSAGSAMGGAAGSPAGGSAGSAGIPRRCSEGCNDGEFCLREICGDADGVCTEMPSGCIADVDPVCGCDGVTYSNGCEAYRAGVSIDYPGACVTDTCFDDTDCGSTADWYCEFTPCGEDTGHCRARPQICGAEEDPVCGCDGTTYGNRCTAEMSGVSIKHSGRCSGGSCFGSDMCADGEICMFIPCMIETGRCVTLPEESSCPRTYDPVCSCDGKTTYDNSCFALAEGAEYSPGKCAGTLCATSDECVDGTYCDIPGCAAESGLCTEMPTTTACGTETDPVCGCDGTTYDSACLAASRGVSVEHAGGC